MRPDAAGREGGQYEAGLGSGDKNNDRFVVLFLAGADSSCCELFLQKNDLVFFLFSSLRCTIRHNSPPIHGDNGLFGHPPHCLVKPIDISDRQNHADDRTRIILTGSSRYGQLATDTFDDQCSSIISTVIVIRPIIINSSPGYGTNRL